MTTRVGLKYSKNGKKILKTSINSVRKLCTVNELYPGDKKLGTMRLDFLLNMVADFLNKPGRDAIVSHADMLKNIFDFYFTSKSKSSKENFGWMLDYLEYPFYGIAKNKQELLNRERKSIMGLLDKLVVGKWVDVVSVYRYLKSEAVLPRPVYVDKYREMILFVESNKQDYYTTSKRIFVKSETAGTIMILPYLKALFFVLNTLGAISVGYEYPKSKIYRSKTNPWLSVYDGIKEISLTKLGAWLIGRSDDPGFTEDSVAEEIVLDDKRLLISYRGKSPAVNLLLSRIAQPLSFGMNLITFESFLSECRSSEDIKKEIAFFRSDISKKPPEIWEDFFKVLIENADPFTLETDEYYTFTVRKGDSSLVEKLFSDSYLKFHVIKAEDHRIMIKRKYYKSVRARLVELGYFMPLLK